MPECIIVKSTTSEVNREKMPLSDRNTTLSQLKEILEKFRDEREWKQFHTPKNLAEAISIEAGELLENFLWKKDPEIENSFKDPTFREKIKHELADILCFCINLANVTGIDIASAVIDKIEHNRKKYPVEKAKGSAKKYTAL